MAAAVIVIDQSGKPAGVPGEARSDLDLSVAVTFSNDDDIGVRVWRWALIGKPPGSTATLSGVTGPTTTLTPDIEGSYLVELQVNDGVGGEKSRNIGAVLTPDLFRYPAPGEGNEFNESGNTAGWSPAFDFIMRTISASGVTALLSWKDTCRVAAPGNIDIATGLEDGDTVDGVVLATGNRVFLPNQTAPAENGIYVAVASGAASRSLDFNAANVKPSSVIPVSEGTSEETLWILATDAPITVGVTALTFIQLPTTTAPWSAVLAAGEKTVGNNPTLTVGDAIKWEDAQGTPAVRAETDYDNAGSTWRTRIRNAAGAVLATLAFSAVTGNMTFDGAIDVSQVQADGYEFNQVAANPGGVPTNTLYQDDGTNFPAGTLVWSNALAVSGLVTLSGNLDLDSASPTETIGDGTATPTVLLRKGAGSDGYVWFRRGTSAAADEKRLKFGGTENLVLQNFNGATWDDALTVDNNADVQIANDLLVSGTTSFDVNGILQAGTPTTDLSNKTFRVNARPYTLADGPWRMITAASTITANTLALGGTTSVEGATAIQFWTSTAVNTAATQRGSISSAGAWTIGAAGVSVSHEVWGDGAQFADNNTNATAKDFKFNALPYTNANGAWQGLRFFADASDNIVLLGGDTAADSSTQVWFTTAPTLNAVGVLRGSIQANGQWQIGTDAGGATHVVNGAGAIFRSNTTDLTNKDFLLQAEPHTNADGPWIWAQANSTVSTNALNIGGNTGADSATLLQFVTATAVNTAGTLRGSMDNAGAFNWTGQLLLAGAAAADADASANNFITGDGSGGGGWTYHGTSTTDFAIAFNDGTLTRRGEIRLENSATPDRWVFRIANVDRLALDTTFFGPTTDAALGVGAVATRGWSNLALTERADHVGTPTATRLELWALSETPNHLMVTDDAANDRNVSKMVPITLSAQEAMLPGSGGPTIGTLNDVDFIAFTNAGGSGQVANWHVQMPWTFGGQDITVQLHWHFPTDVAGTSVVWQVAVERHVSALDLTADSFAAFQIAIVDPAATTNALVITEITLTSAQIDGVLAGEPFRLRVLRDPAHGSDDFTNDVRLVKAIILET